MILEACVEGPEAAQAAVSLGADRVELCAGLSLGGLTPGPATIQMARSLLAQGQLYVLIRHRGGDFCYSPEEVALLAGEVAACRRMGVDGIVIGALLPDGSIDAAATGRWREAAGDMAFTFHRAFDRCADPRQALEDLIALGVDRVLTSGQAASAVEGQALLQELQTQAADRISLLVGGGVRPHNARALAQTIGNTELHFSAMEASPSSMHFRNALSPAEHLVFAPDRVTGMVAAVR